MKNKRGRPAKFDTSLELISVETAVAVILHELEVRFKDPVVVQRKKISKGHLYNLRSKGKLTAYGDHGCALLDKKEIIRKFCG